MGKQSKIALDTRLQRDVAWRHSLNGRSLPKRQSRAAVSRDVEKLLTPEIERYRHCRIRSPEDWRCATRSSREDRRRIDLVRHLFAEYPVPRFLEDIWTVTQKRHWRYFEWYIAVAQGRSLYRTGTRAWLSKRETHLFLRAPAGNTVQQNLWWAKIMAFSGDPAAAARIAGCQKFATRSLTEFWIAAARFFVRWPTSLNEMVDIIDYLKHMRQENPDYSVAGRTLRSVRRGAEEWHRFLGALHRSGGGRWSGVDLPDWTFVVGKEPQRRAIYRLVQIKSGKALLHEGRHMRHCVVVYKEGCLFGRISIWSMTVEQGGIRQRCLTIELTRDGTIVQARGFANRLPKRQELAVLKRWTASHGLTISPQL